MDAEEPVTVYEAWNSQQAHFLSQMLAEAGIVGRVASDADEMVRGWVPYQVTTCPVLVHRKDIERARALIDDYDNRLKGSPAEQREFSDPYCYHCGESVEAQQSPCPSCGHELDWSNKASGD